MPANVSFENKVDATCVILAGGESRRMGENKAFVRLANVNMFDRVFAVCQQIFPDIIVATKNPELFKYYEATVVRDKVQMGGPLGAIYTGLLYARYDHAFCIACDMPLVNENVVRHLLRYRFDHDAVVPRIHGLLEPLHAVYSKKCIPIMRQFLERGILRAFAFLDEVMVCYCEDDELIRIDPLLSSFTNVNTKDELKQVAENGLLYPWQSQWNEI